MDDDALRAVAEELYGLLPGEFVAARTAAAKEARGQGDKELATAVTALRRPSVAAWSVNVLARERSELVTQVVELGDSLRQAQSLLQGEALRDLARQRRRLVAGVTTEVRSLAADRGQRLSEQVARQVEDTLQAAMTDRDAATAVRSGLLTASLSSTGLESLAEVLAVPLAASPAVAPPAAAPRPTLSVVRDDGRERREAQERLKAAGTALRKAVKARDKATKAHAKGQARVLQLEAGLEELRRALAEAEVRTEEASAELSGFEGEVAEAEDAVAAARAEADAAQAAVTELGR